MSILAAAALPHPPLMIPEIGKGEEKTISATTTAYKKAIETLANLKPETIIIVSPHAPAYTDWFEISPGPAAQGSFAAFNATQVSISVPYDEKLAEKIGIEARHNGVPAGGAHHGDPALDHGTLIPLYYLNQVLSSYSIIRIGISALPLIDHFILGQSIAQAVGEKRVVLIASGDLSHKLKENGPYGYVPEGPALDKRITQALASGEGKQLLEISPSLAEKGAECGLRPFAVMAGAMDKQTIEPQLLCYEGPFGVGYAVASWVAVPASAKKGFALGQNPYRALAKHSIETFLATGKKAKLPEGLPDELTARQAGVFVTLYKNGHLRGCIGTIGPTTASIGEEILQNAVSAATQDPRFPPVALDEVPQLKIGVDVLEPAQAVASLQELDPQTYGVIVSSGGRRGLLLPCLEGIDTVEEQLAIARQKAGIEPDEPIEIERFKVTRHE